MSGPKISTKKVNKDTFLDHGVINARDGIDCVIIENITLDKTGYINLPDISIPGIRKKPPIIIYLSEKAVKNIQGIRSYQRVCLKVKGNFSFHPTFKGEVIVVGNSGSNNFTGNDGYNIFYGCGGNDVFEGKAGPDLLWGGNGVDTAVYSSSEVGVVVDLVRGIGLGGDAQDDMLFSIENLTGSPYADTLTGTVEKNVLIGGDGDDVLTGLGGDDTLDGGIGRDMYVITNGQGIRTIKDVDGGQVMFQEEFFLEETTVTRDDQDLVITKDSDTKVTVNLFSQNKNTFTFASNAGEYNLIETDGQYKFMLASK